eukprot:CAMPEP_0168228470 /NCGR_PEP_ID=MMETSP0140_2-20121125/14692_1 /TAXON_ID=44445 /ORGANISM="Pseudo-nitzschia australis, Strain 10249 10 AB" /LENGTH=126 /DNA_ID=CAMNT_0008160083 /DNA_START=51 /DNA_END=428 /DNA_ORIENTATION=-
MTMSIERPKGIRTTPGQGNHTAMCPVVIFVIQPQREVSDKHSFYKGQDLRLGSRSPGGRGHTRVNEGLGEGLDSFIMDGFLVFAVVLAEVPSEFKFVASEPVPSSSPVRGDQELASSLKTPQMPSF